MDILKNSLGEEHPLYAITLYDLAGVHYSKGEAAEAIKLLRQAGPLLATYVVGEMLGETPDHHDESPQHLSAETAHHFIKALIGIAESHKSLGGRSSEVEGFYTGALDATYQTLELTSAGLSERQQMVMAETFRGYLDKWLSRALSRDNMKDDTAQAVLGRILEWKGAIFSRQRWYRQVSQGPIHDLLSDRLTQVSRQLEQLYGRMHAPLSKREQQQHNLVIAETEYLRELARKENWPAAQLSQELRDLYNFPSLGLKQATPDEGAAAIRVIALAAERDELEAELSRQSVVSSQARQIVTVDDVAKALPENSVLVDFFEFARLLPQQAGKLSYQPSIMASVLRPEGEVKLILLGEQQPVYEQLAAWRACIIKQDDQCTLHHGQELRKALWEPVRSAFGALDLNTVNTVLISPDGYLNLLPWAALPGAEPSTYLIDEFEIVIQPAVQQLPALAKTDERQKGRKSLLLVGNVDYDVHPVPAEPAQEDESVEDWISNMGLGRGSGHDWPRLPKTLNEIENIQQYFLEWTGRGKDQSDSDQSTTEMLTGHDATERRFSELAPQFAYLHLATHGFFDEPPDGQTCQLGLLCSPDHLSGVVMAGANLHRPQLQYGDGMLTAMEVMFLPLKDVELVTLSACVTGLGANYSGEGLLGIQRAFQVAGARSTVSSLWDVDDSATSKLMKRFYHNLWKKGKPRSAALREAQRWLKNETGYSRPIYWAAFQLSGAWR